MSYLIPGVDGVYEYGTESFRESRSLVVVPVGVTGGMLTIEAQYPDAGAPWQTVPHGVVDLSEPYTIRFRGPVGRYRFTLAGVVGSGSVTVAELDNDVPNGIGYGGDEIDVTPELSSGPNGFRRMRVDQGGPGFWAGAQFGFAYEFNIPAAGVRVIKFDTPVNAFLLSSSISIDTGGIRYRVFGGPGITETAPFPDTLPAIPLNTVDFITPNVRQTVISTGGTIDTTGLVPYPIARLKTSGATAQQSTVTTAPTDVRGFAPGIAYIHMQPLSGVSGASTGTINLRFEERLTWDY